MSVSSDLPAGTAAKCRLNLFSKTPIPGRVKTRLAKHIGDETASFLGEKLIEWTVDSALAYWPGEVVLHVWPSTNHPLFNKLSSTTGVEICCQVAGNLGQKMSSVLVNSTDNHTVNAVMGCDVPHIGATQLQMAAKAMVEKKTVVGPASDGGFYLLAMNDFCVKYFAGVQWGTSNVYQQLTANIESAGGSLETKLDTLTDLDRLEDLFHVASFYPPLAQFLVQKNICESGL
ncbi:MAG: rSAM/selenodomain-associated transferase 1 [Parasphingorhabdus sp.]|jgi:rSAM/selenodomain-associated transferase 1